MCKQASLNNFFSVACYYKFGYMRKTNTDCSNAAATQDNVVCLYVQRDFMY